MSLLSRFRWFRVLCVGMSPGLASMLCAAPIAHEPFDYRPRLALPTQEGGTGFSGPWQMVSSRDVVNPDGGYIGGGRAGGIGEGDLALAGLASSGNRYRSWVWTDSEAADVKQWRLLATSYDNSAPGATDLWVSYVVTVSGSAPTSSQFFEVNFHQIDPATPNPYIQTAASDAARTTTLRIGKISGRSGWSWAWTKFQGDSGAANVPAADTRYFVVAKVSPKSGGGSTISLWVNPAIGATAPTTGDLATGISDRNSNYPVKFNAIGISHDKSVQIDLDEIRVGTTWADVCPTAAEGRMVVTGNGHRLTSGAVAQGQNHTDFGPVAAGSGSIVRTFTITNEGSGALGSLAASVGGGSGFSVTTAPASSLAATAPGSTTPAGTTVAVTFAPTVAGPAADTLTLSHSGVGSFAIPLTGFGTAAGAGLTLSQPADYRVFQRNASGLATVPVAGNYTGTVSKIQFRTRLHAGAAGTETGWTDLVSNPAGGTFSANLLLPAGGWYFLDVRTVDGATETARATVDRVGSGEVFVTSGQSNSANAGAYPNGAPDDRVATVNWTLADHANGGVAFIRVTNGGSGYTSPPTVSFSGTGGATATAVVTGGAVTGVTVTNAGTGYQSAPTVSFSGGGGTGAAATAFLYPSSDSTNWPQTLAWRRGDAPLGPADGNRGSVWPMLGGKLVEALGVPVAFISVGKGGMPIEAWRDGDGRQLLWPLLNALNYVGPSGARAVLWHQGESNGHMTTAGAYYNEINALIARSRSSCWAVDWVVAQASILNDAATNPAVVGDQAKIAADLAYVHPGPNTDQMLNATGSDPLYRNNPGVRWDNIHFNPKGMEMHAGGWVTKLNEAYALPSILASAPPSWTSGYPKADSATLTGFTLRVSASEAATAYYIVLADGSPAPSAAQVKAGLDASGATALRSGTLALTAANTEYSTTLTGLDSGTSYTAYWVAEDGDGNLQSTPVTVAASTLSPDTTPPAWTDNWPKVDSTTNTGFTVRARTNENGVAYYVVVASGSSAPSAAQVKAGQNAAGSPALKSGSLALGADVENSTIVTGLAAGTTFDVYAVAEDNASPPNLQTTPVKVSISTLPTDAGLISYEGFTYAGGETLAGKGGGTGWGGNWTVAAGSAPVIDAASLAVGDLQSSGGAVSQNSAATINNITRDLPAVLGGNVTSSSPLTLWLSFAHKGNGSDSGDSYLSFYRDGGTVDALTIGRSSGATGFRVTSALSGATTGSALPFDTTPRFILVRIDLSRNTTGTGTNVYTARMWGYTTLPTSEPAVGTENQKIVSGTAGAGTGLKGLRLYDAASGANSQFDEIRLGSNYSSVVPVAAPPTALESWRQTHFGTTTATGTAADSADPDADGIPNLVEYAFESDPTDPSDPSNLPQPGVNGDNLTLSFTPMRLDGLTYIIEASSDLSDWSDQFELTGLLTAGEPHTYIDSADLRVTQRRFLRLQVQAN